MGYEEMGYGEATEQQPIDFASLMTARKKKRSFGLPGFDPGFPEKMLEAEVSPEAASPAPEQPPWELQAIREELGRSRNMPRRRPDLGAGAFESENGEVQKPGRMAKVLGLIGTGLAGAGGGLGAAGRFNREYFDMPYHEELGRAQQEVQLGRGKVADLLKSLDEGRKFQVEKREAEASRALIGQRRATENLRNAQANKKPAEPRVPLGDRVAEDWLKKPENAGKTLADYHEWDRTLSQRDPKDTAWDLHLKTGREAGKSDQKIVQEWQASNRQGLPPNIHFATTDKGELVVITTPVNRGGGTGTPSVNPTGVQVKPGQEERSQKQRKAAVDYLTKNDLTFKYRVKDPKAKDWVEKRIRETIDLMGAGAGDATNPAGLERPQ